MGSGTKHALDFNDAAEEARINLNWSVGGGGCGERSLGLSQCLMHFNAHVHVHFNLLLLYKNYERAYIHIYCSVLKKRRIFVENKL